MTTIKEKQNIETLTRLYKICRNTGLTAQSAYNQAKRWITSDIDTNKINLVY